MLTFDAVRTIFWSIYLRIRGAKVGRNLRVGGPFNILLRDGAMISNLVIGDNVTFDGKTYIRMRKTGKIKLCNSTRIGTDVWLVVANDSNLVVGENSVLGSYSMFNAGYGLRIGLNCLLAGFIYVNTSNHNYMKSELIRKQGFSGAAVEIGDDVWIGGHVCINKGVRIGNGAVIGSGAVVTKDIPEYQIAVGNPARIIKPRE